MEIVEKLKEKWLSVAEISAGTGIPAARIYKWFGNKNKPKHEDSVKLENYLISIEDVPRATHETVAPADDYSAKAIYKLTESNHVLITDHSELINQQGRLISMVEKLTINSTAPAQPERIAVIMKPYLEQIANNGVKEGVWKSEDDALIFLSRSLKLQMLAAQTEGTF